IVAGVRSWTSSLAARGIRVFARAQTCAEYAAILEKCDIGPASPILGPGEGMVSVLPNLAERSADGHSRPLNDLFPRR
ncbi:MAG: hypothetical protein J0I13_15330, partial [Rhizobiales bacterium]|nr:hypothetical protein [Hyphomicrobiales bacterium]